MCEEREKKEYCPKCKEDTIMMIHTSRYNPTTYTCMDCGQTYAEFDGELILFIEKEEM